MLLLYVRDSWEELLYWIMSLSGADLFMLDAKGTDEGVVKIELAGL